MKIAFGINLFGSNIRQELCVQSLVRLKEEFGEEIELYNVQFENDKNAQFDDRLITLNKLKQRSGTFVSNAQNKHLPITSEIFDILSETNCEYFAYTNNDIIVSNRLIKHIKKTKANCYPVSRLAIYPISGLDEPIKCSHYQVAGFDTFVVKTNWWKQQRDKFPPYILGFPAWDVHYATAMMKYGENVTLANKWPPYAFHIIHESPWKTSKNIPERIWNEKIFWREHQKDICTIWNKYLFDVLLKRTNEYRTPLENELELEKKYFKNRNE